MWLLEAGVWNRIEQAIGAAGVASAQQQADYDLDGHTRPLSVAEVLVNTFTAIFLITTLTKFLFGHNFLLLYRL